MEGKKEDSNLLDEFQKFIGLLQALQDLVDVEHGQHMLVNERRLHDVTPVLVHSGEAPALFWHLSHDVRGGKDGLQVQPGRLDLQPLIQDVLQHHQLAFPFPETQVTRVRQTVHSHALRHKRSALQEWQADTILPTL